MVLALPVTNSASLASVSSFVGEGEMFKIKSSKTTVKVGNFVEHGSWGSHPITFIYQSKQCF